MATTTLNATTTASRLTANASDQRSDSAPAPTMRAVTQNEYGDSSVLRVTQVARPQINSDQVLIEVYAAGLDRGTEHLMTGKPWLVRFAGFGVLRPKQPVLGLDVAGVVVAVGESVTRFGVGDSVFGIASGSFAEFAVASEEKLALKPANITFEQAAVSTVSGITALEALTDVGCLEAGQRVLVVGASGGVGSFAVQLAKALGAIVDGVAGTANLDLVRSLGADTVYDHRSTDIANISSRYDLILDIGGRNPVSKLRNLLTSDGTIVFVGGENGNSITGGIGRTVGAVLRSPFVGHRLTGVMSTEHYSFIERLAEFLEAGSVVPAIGKRFPLDQAIDALRLMENGGVSGKTAIVVKPTAPASTDQ